MVVRDALEILTPATCEHLLATTHFHLGRLAYIHEDAPHVVPVNFRYRDGAVYFRLADGLVLDIVRAGSPVAFEIDGADVAWEEGWSVVVHGVASEVTDPRELEQLHRLPLRPWAGEDRSHYVRLPADRMTGRRIS